MPVTRARGALRRAIRVRRYGDFLAGQSVRSGHLALAGPASAQRAAFLQQFFTRSAVYGSVHTPASQQGTVRSVYYGIHLQLRDVSHDYFYPVFHVSLRMVCCYAPKIAKGHAQRQTENKVFLVGLCRAASYFRENKNKSKYPGKEVCFWERLQNICG